MNIKPYYPTLNLGSLASLQTLRQQMDLHPDYLEREDCPYDQDTREQLGLIMAPREIEKIVEVPVEKIIEKKVEVFVAASEGGGKRGAKPKKSGGDIDEVAREIDEIRQELRQMKIDGKGLQVSDRIQMVKTRAGLVEKMLQMAERSHNVKKMSLFQSTVMGILDDLMDDERRQQFMKRMEPFAEAE